MGTIRGFILNGREGTIFTRDMYGEEVRMLGGWALSEEVYV